MNATPDPFAAGSLVWPLTVLTIALVILRKVDAEMRPIVSGMVSGLAAKSARNAENWALAALMASAASCQALGEVATDLGWGYVAAAAKVLQPGLVAVIAFVMRSPAQSATTNPPFNSTTPVK